ncbi:MAG: hypothetical protein IJ794_04255 [Lachnospiraceae bacterium]|nr:hypothetical protein [Lachnospiraceae bacterium]
MKVLHNRRWIWLLAAGLMLLSGCDGAAKAPETVTQNSLVIDRDGSVTAHLVDVFDREYYSIDDLSLMAQKEAQTYNQKHAAKPNAIVLLNIGTVENNANSVIVSYQFKDTEVYTDYMEQTLFYGTAEEAGKAGYDFAQMNRVLYTPSGESSIVSAQLADSTGTEKLSQKHVVLLEEPALVYCPYRVKYISDGARLMEDGSIDTTGVYADKYPVVIVLDK